MSHKKQKSGGQGSPSRGGGPLGRSLFRGQGRCPGPFGPVQVPLGEVVDLDGRIKVALIAMTPERATEFYALNIRTNRNRSRHNIENYKADMLASLWSLNGEPIVIDETKNELINGQNRLTAVIESGVTVLMLVVWVKDANAFATIDIGKLRSPGDILKIDGIDAPTNVAAIAGIVSMVESAQVGNPVKIRKSLLTSFVEEHPGIVEAAKFAKPMARHIRKTVPLSVFGALYYFWSMADEPTARGLLSRFAKRYTDSRGEHDPTCVLRGKLDEYAEKKITTSKTVLLHLFHKCWEMEIAQEKAGKSNFQIRPALESRLVYLAGMQGRFSELVDRTGLQKTVLAKRLGIHTSTLQNYASNRQAVPREVLQQVLRIIRNIEADLDDED